MRPLRIVLLVVACALSSREASAIDPFEIQVYDATADEPGTPGLELHLNHAFGGVKTADPPELPMEHQTHFTLEPSIGVTRFLELGGYLQTALLGDGTFEYAGTKLRAKFVTPAGWREHLRLGLNLEVSLLPQHYDRNRWGGEIRPIAAWEDEHWLFAINPIADVPLAAPGATQGPSFEPAGMAKVKIVGKVAVGIEYYSSFGPISSPLPWAREAQYVYEAVDVLAIPRVELNAGIGEGLTSASDPFVAKFIVGYSWENEAPDAAPVQAQ